MFLPRKFNVFDDHLVVSKLGSGCSTDSNQIKTCQVLLTNIEDSHANRQCFYERPFILQATVHGLSSVLTQSCESFGGN